MLLRCEHEPCSRVWRRAGRAGRTPRYCSDACKQANHRVMSQLDAAGKASHRARQQQRRQAWIAREAAAWEAAERQRMERLGLDADRQDDRPAREARRVVTDLEALARAIAAARARGRLNHDTQVSFYQRFLQLETAAAVHEQLLSTTLGDAQAALQLVKMQLGGLLTDDING
jgi:hypothetical protein